MATPVLEARKLYAGYGGRAVLADVSMRLHAGEVVCLIGHNGAGKSTLLKTLYGLVQSEDGTVLVDGAATSTRLPVDMARAGIALVPEGRGVFPQLSVADNFRLGLSAIEVEKTERHERVEEVLELLPAIKSFISRRAGTLSGGQQQMVSIGRALLGRPRCLLMDEPSIGLAPKLFHDLITPIRELQRRAGLGILLVEQNLKEAFRVSDRVIAMKSGAIVLESTPAELTDHRQLMELY
jgi:branched-chain amino acid transport system ATP-binding protein